MISKWLIDHSSRPWDELSTPSDELFGEFAIFAPYEYF